MLTCQQLQWSCYLVAAQAALQDCGEGPLPSGIVCYEGQLLVETFKVKVTNSDGTTGSLDMQATGTVTTGDPEIPPKSCSCCFFQMVMLRYPMVLSWGYIIYIYVMGILIEYWWNTNGYTLRCHQIWQAGKSSSWEIIDKRGTLVGDSWGLHRNRCKEINGHILIDGW